MKEITQEIQAIIRQITASVSFLPLLNEPCCFDLLVYADRAATVPVTWEDSDPCIIAKSEEVRLRSFSTKVCMYVCIIYHPRNKIIMSIVLLLLLLCVRFIKLMQWFLTKPVKTGYKSFRDINEHYIQATL